MTFKMNKFKKHQTVFLIVPLFATGFIIPIMTGTICYIRGKVEIVHRKQKDFYTVRTKKEKIKCWQGGIAEFPHELMYSYTVL